MRVPCGEIMTEPLRIGILGAAAIVPRALIRPARGISEVVVAAIAARDPLRAEAFARKHGIARVHECYDAMVTDPNIDAVYIPLPNSLHSSWTVKALHAGKHVLCEKPLASNAEEAVSMVDAAERSGKILVEAVHYRYHPLAHRVHEIVSSGKLGKIQQLDLFNCFPVLRGSDIRYRFDLAGGSLMDMGSYSVNFARYLMGTEPEVLSAEARLAAPNVDRWMRAHLQFPGGTKTTITCSIWSARLLHAEVRVAGETGNLTVVRPNTPHLFGRLHWSSEGISYSEKPAAGMTYEYQLRAFVNAVRHGGPIETTAADGVKNMRVIDAIYRKAGLAVRGVQTCGTASRRL